MRRDDVLGNAIDQCLKELYSFVQPSIEWDEFIKENKIYSEKYKEWKFNRENHEEWKDKSITECIGPRPCDFYYIPKEIMKDICDSYIYAYKLDSQQELLDTIEILKNYFKEPIVDKYIDAYTDENGNYHPGHRGYDHPSNLKEELSKIIPETGFDRSEIVDIIINKVHEFLDMAGNFYNWNRDLSNFNFGVYMGASPNNNKEVVIDNWKKYRNKDIEIDDSKFEEEYE